LRAALNAILFDVGKVGSELLVNTETTGDQFKPTITALNNGGFVATWQDLSGTMGDSSTSVKAQIFAPHIYNAITGTSAKDTLTGTAGDDHILGLDGNDTLAGLVGNDLLDGGLGNDKMSGGQGDEINVFGAKGDKVVENAGEGTDMV